MLNQQSEDILAEQKKIAQLEAVINPVAGSLLNKPQSDWITMYKEMTQDGIRLSFKDNREYRLAKDEYTATTLDNFMALASVIRDRLVERWIMTQQRYHKQNLKRVYYLSLEFLIGRLLGNNIINLGIEDQVSQALESLGIKLEELRDQEQDAGLGNGGLGRLAACFLDSMATLGIPAHGYGIRYDFGIFNQKISNGYQVELPDEWLKFGNPWELAHPEYTVRIHFYGKTYSYTDKKGKFCVQWVDTENVLAVPYDIPVPGYKNDVVNTLRLWSAHSTEEFDFDYFNHGDYERAVNKKVLSENISKVLYPNDVVVQGKELRLKQEYFFTAASIADIIRRFKSENADFKMLPEKVAIQLNDTHPALAIVELMRILVDEESLEWDHAWDITTRTFAYTNHTVMPEALEVWPVYLFELLLPRHLQIIYEINLRFLQEVSTSFPQDIDRLGRMSVIAESDPKNIRMAHLCIIGSHSVNGVSQLHSQLLKDSLFKDFYELWPQKFNNKTNGITPRRWLLKANKPLTELLYQSIGPHWIANIKELDKIMLLSDDWVFQNKWQVCKQTNKKILTDYIWTANSVRVDPESLFDVQIKRIHEYKRQLLFSLYIIREYLKIKQNPNKDVVPRTYIFSGKAAPGYFMAKLIIKFINSIAEVINKDKGIQDKIKVVFLENYRVSLAEKIFPASDLSEQISTAGTEASGTGCMKFMLNGALTICTYDGANIEIAREVGQENIFMFGLEVDEINALRMCGYNPRDYIGRNPELAEVISLIQSDYFNRLDPGLFQPILDSLVYSDHYFVCADFASYCAVQDAVSLAYKNKSGWIKKSVINVAKSFKFSSDRTVQEYAREIWGV